MPRFQRWRCSRGRTPQVEPNRPPAVARQTRRALPLCRPDLLPYNPTCFSVVLPVSLQDYKILLLVADEPDYEVDDDPSEAMRLDVGGMPICVTVSQVPAWPAGAGDGGREAGGGGRRGRERQERCRAACLPAVPGLTGRPDWHAGCLTACRLAGTVWWT